LEAKPAKSMKQRTQTEKRVTNAKKKNAAAAVTGWGKE